MTHLVENGPQELDMLTWMTRTAMEHVGQGGIGHSFDVFSKADPTDYANSIQQLL